MTFKKGMLIFLLGGLVGIFIREYTKIFPVKYSILYKGTIGFTHIANFKNVKDCLEIANRQEWRCDINEFTAVCNIHSNPTMLSLCDDG